MLHIYIYDIRHLRLKIVQISLHTYIHTRKNTKNLNILLFLLKICSPLNLNIYCQLFLTFLQNLESQHNTNIDILLTMHLSIIYFSLFPTWYTVFPSTYDICYPLSSTCFRPHRPIIRRSKLYMQPMVFCPSADVFVMRPLRKNTVRFSLQNAVYFIMLPFLVPVLFTFYIGVY